MCNCNKPKICQETNSCACEVFLTSDCINNIKSVFECLDIATGLTLTETLEAMDAQICVKFNTITNYFTIINVGTGAELYKGVNNLGQKEFRTIVKEGNLVTVEQDMDTIIIGIDETALTAYVQTNQKTTVVSNAGDGAPLVKTAEVSGDETTYPIKSLKYSAQDGEGESLIRDLQQNTDDITIRGKKIKSDGSLVITSTDEEVLITTPVNESDIKFYVNEQYTGGNEDGSLARPYTNMFDAFEAFKGAEGTILQPQYGGIASIELLNNVTVPSTGAKAMTYVSMNKLKIKGNGFSLIYKGTQDYFISTEYLVGLDAKSDSGKLDNNINMKFENLVIVSETVHGIVDHLNYTSPSISTMQNTSSIEFIDCSIIDNAYLGDLSSYTDTGVILFGGTVYAQNVLDKDVYMIKNKDVNWIGEGNFSMTGCSLMGASSTIIYNLNSSISWLDITINFNSNYINYEDIAVDVYNPRLGLYYIYNENNGLSGRAENFLRIENIKENSQESSSGGSIIGGSDSFYRGVGNTVGIFNNGSFYSEKVNNILQIHSPTSFVEFTNINCTQLQVADTIYGAFKYTGTLPVSPIFVSVYGSIINNVKNWTTLQFIRPLADVATINGAYYTSNITYADNTAALAAGLVPGNTYFNTTTNISTRVV